MRFVLTFLPFLIKANLVEASSIMSAWYGQLPRRVCG
jgi:hypothetical protein